MAKARGILMRYWVIFVSSNQLKEVVLAVLRGGDMVAGTYIPSGTPIPYNVSELDALEVTTRLEFEE